MNVVHCRTKMTGYVSLRNQVPIRSGWLYSELVNTHAHNISPSTHESRTNMHTRRIHTHTLVLTSVNFLSYAHGVRAALLSPSSVLVHRWCRLWLLLLVSDNPRYQHRLKQSNNIQIRTTEEVMMRWNAHRDDTVRNRRWRHKVWVTVARYQLGT